MAGPLAIAIFKPGPNENITPYQILHIVLGVSIGILTFISSYMAEEKGYIKYEEQPGFFKALAISFKNKSFLIFEILSFTVIYVQTALFQGLFYYADEIDVNIYVMYAALIFSTIATLVFLLMKYISWGVKLCMRICLAGVSLGCYVLLLGGKNFYLSLIGFLLLGMGVAAGFYLLQIQFGDVMDADEIKTGLRREGIYAGVNSLVTKPAISFANAAFGWILIPYGYDEDLPKGAQSAEAETGILVAWMLIPAILLTISFIAMKWYPLAGESWRIKKKKLQKNHKEKEKAKLEELGFQYTE
jgi:glycoside/pentoside/hexuronide:cation symporter, GPH family